jgi:hypothetical protein
VASSGYSKYSGWISDHDCSLWDVLGDYSSGTNGGVIADLDGSDQDAVRPQVDIVSDNRRLPTCCGSADRHVLSHAHVRTQLGAIVNDDPYAVMYLKPRPDRGADGYIYR